MKVLIITGSRADWNGLGMVARALIARGHLVNACALTTGNADAAQYPAMCEDLPNGSRGQVHLPSGDSFSKRAGNVLSAVGDVVERYGCDLALLAGDRWEVASAALAASMAGIPLVHIAGGDLTEGSADDRYRDAITALASVHCATNVPAYVRLSRRLIRLDDLIALTGSPAIDRIKATTPKAREHRVLDGGKRNVLVQVHPNTVGGDVVLDAVHTVSALVALRATQGNLNVVALGSADDPGKTEVDKLLRATADTFLENLTPAEYYWLLGAVDVLVGNSSAALYEAPSFGLPLCSSATREKGRIIPSNVIEAPADATMIVEAIKAAFTLEGPFDNPYDRGDASAHVVQGRKAFWLSRTNAVPRETLPVNLAAAAERLVPRYEDQPVNLYEGVMGNPACDLDDKRGMKP